VESWPFQKNDAVHERGRLAITERLEALRGLWSNPEVTAAAEQEEEIDFKRERKKVDEKIRRVADGYAEGVLDKRTARRLREEAQDELAKLDAEEKRRAAQREALDPVAAQQSLLEAMPAVSELWREGEPSEQREIAELLTEAIKLFPDGRLEFIWRDASQVVKKLGLIGGGGLLNKLTGDSGARDRV
jgi:hypothetical protein